MKTRKKLGQNWNQQYTSSQGGSSTTQQDASGLTVLSASSKQLQLSSTANPTGTNVWKKAENVVEDAVIPQEEEEKSEPEPETETATPTVAQSEIVTTTVVTPSTTIKTGDSPELLISVAAWDEYGGRGTNKKNGKQPQLVETTAPSAPEKTETTPIPLPQQQPARKPRRGGRNNKKLQALKTAAQEPSRESPKSNSGAPRKLFDPSTGSLVEFAPQSTSSNNRGGGSGRDHHRHHGRGRHSNRNHNNGSNNHHRNGSSNNSKRVTLLKETAPVKTVTATEVVVDEGDLKASAKSFSPRPTATEPTAEPTPDLDLNLDALVVTAPVSSTSQTNKSSNIFAFGSSGTWGAAAGATDWSMD